MTCPPIPASVTVALDFLPPPPLSPWINPIAPLPRQYTCATLPLRCHALSCPFPQPLVSASPSPTPTLCPSLTPFYLDHTAPP